MSYALSGAAIIVAALASYEIITGAEILPELTGPVLAIGIISASFGYGLTTRNKRKIDEDTGEADKQHKISDINRDTDEPEYYFQQK